MNEILKLKKSQILADADFNSRGWITPLEVIELAKDIQSHGLISPVVVIPLSGNIKNALHIGVENKEEYLLVVGYRRQMAVFTVNQSETIDAIVRPNMTIAEARMFNLSENINRKDLNILQEAKALERIKNAGISRSVLEATLGKSWGYLRSRFYLLDLPEDVQQEAALGVLNQQDIVDLWQIQKKGTREDVYQYVREVKDAKVRGEKKPKILDRHRAKNTSRRAKRSHGEMVSMLDHIMETIGPGLHSRVLAWCTANISSDELFNDCAYYAKLNDKIWYAPPIVDERGITPDETEAELARKN